MTEGVALQRHGDGVTENQSPKGGADAERLGPRHGHDEGHQRPEAELAGEGRRHRIPQHAEQGQG